MTATDVGAFYDRWTPTLMDAAGTTFQGGLIKRRPDGDVTPAESNVYLAELAGIKDGDRILDAGCGVCGPAIDIARAYPNCTVMGLTISEVQADIARRRIAEANMWSRVGVYCEDYHRMPFPTDSFDVVLFLEVTGYSPDLDALYREAARVLRPGGRVYVKDLFRQDIPYSRSMRDFDRLWGLASTPTLPETTDAMQMAGLVDVTTREYPHVDMGHYYRSMLSEDGALNEFGRVFLHREDINVSAGLPVLFGEAKGRKP